MTEIQEVYKEDTSGRRYHAPTLSKKGERYKEPPSEPPVTVNIKRPMRRDEFRRLSDSLKAIYIKSLCEQYQATATQIANMLG